MKELKETSLMIQSHTEQPIEKGKDCDIVRKCVRNQIWSSLSQLHNEEQKKEKSDTTWCIVPCPYAHRGFPYWLIVKPLRETWFMIGWINTMMSLWQQVDTKTNTDNTSGNPLGSHKCSGILPGRCSLKSVNYIKQLVNTQTQQLLSLRVIALFYLWDHDSHIWE